MWMAYAEQMWPKATNLRTAIQRLQCELEAVGWDAMLNINRLANTEEDIQELRVKEKLYFEAVDKCEQYLNEYINVDMLRHYFIDVGLAHYIPDFENFVQ